MLRERIRELMDASGVDAAELVVRLRRHGYEASWDACQAWYTGRRSPNAAAIPALAAALDVTPNDLYGVGSASRDR